MTLPFSYYDLIEACAQPGCPVCSLLLRDAHRFIDSLLYEYVTKPSTNDTFRAARGLCNVHNWQLTRFGSQVLGIAILQDAALDEVLKLIEANPAQASSALSRWLGSNARPALADRLEPERPCPVCESVAETEKMYLDTLNTYLGNERFQSAFRDSAGLCLPHFRAALRQVADADALERLLTLQTTIWQQLKRELETFITKNDYRYAGDPMGVERDSWLRAISTLAGKDEVFGTRREK
ncbi:MAG: hypothetical protein HZC41_26460 [Chloroflexi bacterium]|nr:hypothetical protein [Chloroflexota bacterium]